MDRKGRKGEPVWSFDFSCGRRRNCILLKLINLGCRFCCSHEADKASSDWVSYIFVAVVALVQY